MNDEDRKWLYESLKNEGLDLGTYEEFNGYLNDKDSRDWCYEQARKAGLDVGTRQEFDGYLGYGDQDPVEAEPTASTVQEPAKPTEADYREALQTARDAVAQARGTVQRSNNVIEHGKQTFGLGVKPLKIGDKTSYLRVGENPHVAKVERTDTNGKKRDIYLTASGNEYDTAATASREQNALDKQREFQKKKDEWEEEKQSTFRDLDGKIADLKKKRATLQQSYDDDKSGNAYLAEARLTGLSTLDKQIEDLKAQKEDLNKDIEKREAAFIYENFGQKEQLAETKRELEESVQEQEARAGLNSRGQDALAGLDSPGLAGFSNPKLAGLDNRGIAGVSNALAKYVYRWLNPEYGRTRAALQSTKDVEQTIKNATKDGLSNTWVANLLQGAWDATKDIRTWDFGANDLVNGANINGLLNKQERIQEAEKRGETPQERLTASEQKMLDALALSSTLDANFQEFVPMSYRVGHSVPESAGFAASIYLNPLNGLGRAMGKSTAANVVKGGTKAVLKGAVSAGENALLRGTATAAEQSAQRVLTAAAVNKYGKWGVRAMNAAGRVTGDAIEALGTTLTTGLPRTLATISDRQTGQIIGGYDSNGDIVFNGTDGREKGWKSVAKGVLSSYWENESEMWGEYFAPVSNFAKQSVKDIGFARRAVEAMSSSNMSSKLAMLNKFREKAHISGLFGEYAEEVLNNFANALTIGDMNFTGGVTEPKREDYKTDEEYKDAVDKWKGSVFNAETNLETFLSVAAMMAPMAAVERSGRYYNAYTAKRKLNTSIDALAKALGQDKSEGLVEALRNAESLQDMGTIILQASQDGTITNEKQARALLDVASKMVASQSVNTNDAVTNLNRDRLDRGVLDAFSAGHEIEAEDRHQAAIEYDQAYEAAARLLGSSVAESIPLMSSEDLGRLMEMMPQEQKEAAQNLFLNSMRLHGIYAQGTDAALEETDKYANTLREVQDENGQVFRGSALGESEFIVPSSLQDGSNTIVVRNMTTGVLRMIPREQAGDITSTNTAQELNDLRQKLIAEAHQQIQWSLNHNNRTVDPQVGTTLTVSADSEEGGAGTRLRVVREEDDGTLLLLPTRINGKTGEEEAVSGEPIRATRAELLSAQDDYYDQLEQAEREQQQAPDSAPVQDGQEEATAGERAEGGEETAEATPDTRDTVAQELDSTPSGRSARLLVDGWLANDDAETVHDQIDSVDDSQWDAEMKRRLHEYVDAPAQAEETQSTTEGEIVLSDEVDENGKQFVVSPDGGLAFGEIDEESGLTPAPILLSEGMITNPVTNAGYGLAHIEARHGEQIRKAGYRSVLDFIEKVAKNYEVIREGAVRDGHHTYRLQLTDEHNNTLMVELSGDGTYWNINTAGIFKTSYGRKNKEVYSRHTTAKQSAETVGTSQDVELSGTQTSSRMNVPTSSTGKDTSVSSDGKGKTGENAEKEPPRDADGNLVYDQVPVQDTVEDLYDGVMTDAEVSEFVRLQAEEAEKALAKIEGKTPKMMTNKAKYMQAKARWEADVKEARRKVDYWHQVADEVKRISAGTQAEQETATQEAEKDTTPQSGEQLAAQVLAGSMITPQSYRAETGYKLEEQKKHVGLISNEGQTIDQLAERLTMLDTDQHNGQFFDGDSFAAKDAILSVLQQAGTRGEILRIADGTAAQTAQDAATDRYEEQAREQFYQENYGMSYEDYLAYEEQELPAMLRHYHGFDEQAFMSMYADEIENEQKARENDTTGEERGTDGGTEVLPDERADNARGDEGRTERDGETETGHEGRAAQETVREEETPRQDRPADGTLTEEEARQERLRAVDSEIFPEEFSLYGTNSRLHDYQDGVAVYVDSEGNPSIYLAGSSNGDYVGVFRDASGRWSSKMENQSGNKETFKQQISSVMGMLPEGAEFYEHTNVSADGLRVFAQQLRHGFKRSGETYECGLNGEDKAGVLGDRFKGDGRFNSIYASEKDLAHIRKALKPFMEALGMTEDDVRLNEDGKVVLRLPVLVKDTAANEDNQGNPLNADGSLRVEQVRSVDELTDEDFSSPTRSVQLPALPANVDAALGAEGKPVVIKKNILERNAQRHPDITAEQSREILRSALYNPDLYGQNQKAKRPYNWVVINTKDENGKNRVVLLEVSRNKDNVEIVHWHYMDERGIEKIRRQAEREDGQLLILPSESSEEAGALSSPTHGLSSEGKDTDNQSDLQGNEEKSEELNGVQRRRRRGGFVFLNGKPRKSVEEKFAEEKFAEEKFAEEKFAEEKKKSNLYSGLYKEVLDTSNNVQEAVQKFVAELKDLADAHKDWANRVYKANSNTVSAGEKYGELEAGAPMRIDAINENRRQKVLRGIEKEAKEVEGYIHILLDRCGIPKGEHEKYFVKEGTDDKTHDEPKPTAPQEPSHNPIDGTGKPRLQKAEAQKFADHVNEVQKEVDQERANAENPAAKGDIFAEAERQKAREEERKKQTRTTDAERQSPLANGTQEERMQVAERVAKALGAKLVIVDHMEENGRFSVNRRTGERTITIARDAEDPLAFVFGHESLHAVRNKSEEAYQSLRSIVRAAMGKKAWDAEVAKAVEMYKGQKGYDSLGDYEEEVVAQFLGGLLNDKQRMASLAQRLDHPVLAAIMDVLRKIRDFFRQSGMTAQERWLSEMQETVEAAYRQAAKAAKGQGTSSRASLRQADSDIFEEAQRMKEEEELNKINKEFNERLSELYQNPNQKNRVLKIGKTGRFLLDGGLTDAEIELEFDRLLRKSKESYENKHSFDVRDIRDLPKSLNAPIAVFTNTNGKDKGHVILTESKKEGKNYIVAVRAAKRNKKGGVRLEVNEITTLFPKDERGIIKWINSDSMSNVDKRKALRWIEALRNHHGTELTEKELSSAAKVVENFEKPATDEEKSSEVLSKSSLRNTSDKTLVGVHNISEEKLLKALKLGGLANPSVAVIDSDKQTHTGYGGISLILPSSMVAKRTGKNAGTFFGDAWTPTYPQVERQFGKGGSERAAKDIDSVPEEMQRMTRNAIDAWMDGRDADNLAYLYLQEKGQAPSLVRMAGKYDAGLHKAMLDLTHGDSLYKLDEEGKKEVLDLLINQYYEGDRKAFDKDIALIKERLEERLSKIPNQKSLLARSAKENLDWIEDHGYDYDMLYRFVDDVNRDAETAGEVSDSQTMLKAQQKIEEDNLKQDFERWKNSLSDRYGIKEVIFDGFTPSGNRRYVPNDLAHVSRIMKKKGLAGAEGAGFSFNQFSATLMEQTGNLAELRKRKDMLTEDHADMDTFTAKWAPVYNSLAEAMNPNSTDPFDDTGYYRLAEAALRKDPKAYAKEEYGVDLTEQQVEGIHALVNAIRTERPAMYFETKFVRPVGFDEFASAVVPNNLSAEARQGLEKAGLSLYEYDPKKEGDRKRAFGEATDARDDIKFSLRQSGTSTDIFEEAARQKAEETALRDALTDRMRQAGLDVVTDSQEGQRVLDEVNGRARMSAKKKRALETVSVSLDEKHHQTAISSADGAKILKNLDSLTEDYENSPRAKEKTFLGETAKSLGINGEDKSSKYATFETQNGKVVTIRLSNHNATVSNFDNRGEEDGISLVITPKPNQGMTVDGHAHVTEFYYNAIKLRRADGKPLAEILRSIKQALYSGEFHDTTGLADVQEVNADEVIRYHKVYHRSGADFEQFDHSHMGEGEGAQAYGWGTYVTEVEGIGRTYANSAFFTAEDRRERRSDTPLGDAVDAIIGQEKYNSTAKNFEQRKAVAIENYERTIPAFEKGLSEENDSRKVQYLKLSVERQKTTLEALRTLTEEQYEEERMKQGRMRHLYTVEIPEDTGDNYLEWDKKVPAKTFRKVVKAIDADEQARARLYSQTRNLPTGSDSLARLKFALDKMSTTTKKNTGWDLYDQMCMILGSEKSASEFLSSLGFTGIKYPAQYQTGGRADGAKNYVIFDEKDLKITDHVRFFRTANGEAYGYTVYGKIYIDPRVATAETPIHEYAHLWATALQRESPSEWENVVELIKGTPAWDEARRLYPELENDDEVADEVLALYSGRRGAARLREEQRKVTEGKADLFGKAEALQALERVRQALTAFWQKVADMLHIRFTSAEEVADRVMRDLLEGVDPTIEKEKSSYTTEKASLRRGETGARVGKSKLLRNRATITFRRKQTTTYNAVKKWLTDNSVEFSDHKARTGSMYMSFWAGDVDFNIRNSDHTRPEFGGGSEYGQGESVFHRDNKIESIDIDLCNSELKTADIRRLVAEVSVVNNEDDAVRKALLYDNVVPRNVEQRYPVLCKVLGAENEEIHRLKTNYAAYAEGVRAEMLSKIYPFTTSKGIVIEQDGRMSHPRWSTIWKNDRYKALSELYDAKTKILREADQQMMDFDEWVKEQENGKASLRHKASRDIFTEARMLRDEERKEAHLEMQRRKAEAKELYANVLQGDFDDVTLQQINDYIDKSTTQDPYGRANTRPLSERLPPRVGLEVHEGERTGSVDALISRISESTVPANERTRPEAKRRIEERKKELLKGWAIATGNWHTDIRDFVDDTKPIGHGKDSDVYYGKDGKSVIKVSHGKENLRKFRPDLDNVALFNTVFKNSKYTILGYGEIGGRFVRFLQQPIVDFTGSTPLSVKERVAYMQHLGFQPMNEEKTAFTNGTIVASDIQGNNIVRDHDGNIRVIDADMRLHTKEVGGEFAYPPVENDTETRASLREGTDIFTEAERMRDEAERARQAEEADEDTVTKASLRANLRPDTQIRVVAATQGHGFKNYQDAKDWAREHIARTYSNQETGGKGEIRISNTAIDKYLSESAVAKSESRDAHLSVLKVLPDVIRESVDAEQHPDYKKNADGVRGAESGVNPDVTIHRLYGAVRIGDNMYRVKVTLKENARTKETTKAYSYEATKIELLDGQHGDVTMTSPRYSSNSISAAKLLKDAEKSYGGGKFFADTAEKASLRRGESGVRDIFQEAQEARDEEETRFSLRNNNQGSGWSRETMQKAWDDIMSRASFMAKEGYWDYLASVEEFQNLMEKATGRAVSDLENAYQAMLALSSRNANEMKLFDSALALPLQKAVLAVAGAVKDFKTGEGRALAQYLIAKHGIERNRDMAVRAALKEETGKDTDLYTQRLDDWYDEADRIKQQAQADGWTWRQTQEALTQAAETYGGDMSKDYSGLTGMLTEEDADDRLDTSTATGLAYDMVESYEGAHEHLDELWQAVHDIAEYSLGKQQRSGLVGKDYVEDQHRRYEYFVPLRGFADPTAEDMYGYLDGQRANGGLGSPVKTAKGRVSEAADPLGNLLNVAYRSIASGNKNMALQHFYNLVNGRDTSGLAVTSKMWVENVGTDTNPDWVLAEPQLTDPMTGGREMTGEEVQAEMERFEADMEAKREAGTAKQLTGGKSDPQYRIVNPGHKRSHQVRLNVGGRARVITIAGNPRVAMALNGLLNPESSAWPILQRANNFMASAFTNYNVSFGLANLARDTMQSNMRTFIMENPLYWAKFTRKQGLMLGNVANCARMIRMMLHREAGKQPNGYHERMFKEFLEGGGATGYTMIRSQEEASRYVADIVRDLKNAKRRKLSPMRLFELFSFLNESTELVNRFIAYETSREMGRTVERSVDDAKEATLNFNRKGAGAKSITDKEGAKYRLANALNYYSQYGRSFIVFFNAFAQSQRQLYKMMTEHPAKFTAAFFVAPVTAAAVALPAINNLLLPALYGAAGGDGDDDNYGDYYEELSDWERQHNICIRLPKGHGWLKIPMSQELATPFALGDVTGAALNGQRSLSASDASVLLDLVTPNNINAGEPGVSLVSFLPSGTQFAGHIAINRDFKGSKLYNDSPFARYQPNWRTATRNTSKSLVALSRAANKIAGGSDERDADAWYDWKPGYVQEMLTGLAGGWASTALAVSDAVLPIHLAGGGTEKSFAENAQALFDRGGIPVVSRFLIPGSGTRNTARAKSDYINTVKPMMGSVESELSLIKGLTKDAAKDVARTDRLLKDAEKDGDVMAIAEAQKAKEEAAARLREKAAEQKAKLDEMLHSERWKAYMQMRGLTKYIDAMMRVYGNGELPANVTDSMRVANDRVRELQ